MSTLMIGAMIIAGTIGIFLLFIAVSNKSAKERNKALLNRFHQSGAEHGLSFSSQEVLNNSMIGLDGVQQKLLVLDFSTGYTISCIALADVKDCTVKKEYENVDFGNSKKPDIELQIRFTGIEFSFIKRTGTFFLPFYDNRNNSVYERKDLETKAKEWQLILSQLLLKDAAVRA